MERLKKVFKIYSYVFIAFGIISFGFSAVSDILGTINSNIRYDVMSSEEMLPYINGGVFIIIGGILQTISGIFGIKAANNNAIIRKPIILSIFAISWQIAGLIILFSNHIINIRLFLQVPMSFTFLVLAFMVHYKNTQGIKKKHIDLTPLTNIDLDKIAQKKDITSVFGRMGEWLSTIRPPRLHFPSFFSGKRRIKRVNIKPVRKFKR